MNRLFIVLMLFATLGIGLFYSCNNPNKEQPPDNLTSANTDAMFVGDQQCASCHADQFRGWQESHHDYAMKEATDEYVRANFDNVSFEHNGEHYRFFRQGDRFMMEYSSPEGKKRYEIRYTFGWEPLQQYLVEIGKGKLQALNIAWDTQKKQWFALNPDQNIQHGEWMHWTGGAMNWNTMCASCHSTNLQKNYVASADSFHTTWSSINVSCESCHGPGKAHVEFAQSEQVDDATLERIRKDLKLTEASSQIDQINQCAQCHALREQITENYSHKGDFLNHFNPSLPHPDSYFADGQIKEEVYVYGSFLQSKMFQEGIECSDCHDPHSLKLKANIEDNSLCMQCHEPAYNSREHTFHKVNTEASQCVNCHMSGRYYMEVDFRRDHRFGVPRPDLSAEFGTPNACNSCHDSKSAEWAANAVEKWYGSNRPNHFSEVLVKADSLGRQAMPELKKLIADTMQADIARATAVWYVGQFPSDEGLNLLKEAVYDESPLVRKSASQALAALPDEMKTVGLQDALDDSVRSVRVIAAGGLVNLSVADIIGDLKSHYKSALEEYKEYLDANSYFPQGQMNRGQYFEKTGKIDKAIEAYKQALKKDAEFNPARINLAHIYNRQGQNGKAQQLLEKVIEQEPSYGPAYYSLALLLAEEKQFEQAISYFQQAVNYLPENPRIRYNMAIAFQTMGRVEEAENAYLKAIELAPETPDFRYGISTLYIQQKEFDKAVIHAQKLVELLPNNRQAQEMLRRVKSWMKQ